jgi:hypothetical protein
MLTSICSPPFVLCLSLFHIEIFFCHLTSLIILSMNYQVHQGD